MRCGISLRAAGRWPGSRYLNIDAMTAWEFRGLRIDSLVRSMWYNPQHSMAAALGTDRHADCRSAGVAAPIGAIAWPVWLSRLSTTLNPLIGGLFSLIYGAVVAADAIRTRRVRTAAAACDRGGARGACRRVVCRATIWSRALRASSCTALAVMRAMRRSPRWRYHSGRCSFRVFSRCGRRETAERSVALGCWLVLGLLVFYFVRLSVEGSYIGFRAGQLLQLALPGLAALFFARLWRGGSRAIAAAAAARSRIGLPTTLIDSFNAQDINNHEMGPGFRGRSS